MDSGKENSVKNNKTNAAFHPRPYGRGLPGDKVKKLTGIMFLFLFLMSAVIPAHAECDVGHILNPVTDVDWAAVFPIRIGGVPVVPGIPDEQDYLPPACVCMIPVGPVLVPKPGITFSMWNPQYLNDVVTSPFCMQSIGVQIPNPAGSFLGGTNAKKINRLAFFQSHLYYFPLFAVMQIAQDVACLAPDGNAPIVNMFTEIDPLWQSDILSAFVSPEVLLFANPIAQLACVADSAAAQIDQPLNFLYWCMGSWGGVYPMDGDTGGTKDFVQDAAAISGKTIFMMHKVAPPLGIPGETGALAISGTCVDYPDPIWQKSAVRLDLSMPVPEAMVQGIGQSGLLWSALKNPPYHGDSFVWTLFMESDCCAI